MEEHIKDEFRLPQQRQPSGYGRTVKHTLVVLATLACVGVAGCIVLFMAGAFAR